MMGTMSVKNAFKITILVRLLFSQVNHAADLPTDEHGDYNGSDMIEWINSHPQGFVHPSLRIGRRIPGDPTSIIGTFVSADAKPIEAGEIIATIPWDCMIGPGDKYSTEIFESCEAVRNLANELKLGDKSQYKPYVNYLLTQTIDMMPGEWSTAAQEFLYHTILLGKLPPHRDDWFDSAGYKRYLDTCRGDPNDRMDRFAYYLTSTRDEDTLMIPIYDMMNHSTDPKKLNTLSYKPKNVGDSFVFKASRRIEPSEEIYNCYTRCTVCSKHFRSECETFSHRGIPDIFAYFGFVDDLPHYWWFERIVDNKLIETEFCLERNETTDGWKVTWVESIPSDDDKAFYNHHLERLKGLQKQKDTLESQLVLFDEESKLSQEKMSRKEWEACWNYFDALFVALEAAIESINRITQNNEPVDLLVYEKREGESEESSSDDDSGDEL